MPNPTDTAISIVDLVGGLARFGRQALPVATFVAGFFPGAAPALHVVSMALPIIDKIAAAAPIVSGALDKSRPIIDAIQQNAPGLLPDLKALLALAINHDPSRPEEGLTAADVTDADVERFAGSIFSASFFAPQDPRFHGIGDQS